MRNKIYPLVALLTATFAMTSCLNDNDGNDRASYKDTAITSFSLGQLKQVRDTVTKAGKDSTYKAKYDAGKVKFYIDQAQGLIYNPDSLPYGTDAAHVLAKITTKNAGTVAIQSVKDASLSYYRSNDSIDFTQPRTFRVYANGGYAYREYKISVNVHKQRGNVFSWKTMQDNSGFASFTAMKAVSTGDRIFVFGTDGTQTTGYVTSKADGNSWTKLGRSFTASAYKSIAVQNSSLFIIDNGTVYSSADGNTWTAVATDSSLKQLVAASPAELFALTAAGSLAASRDKGVTWNAETLDSDASLLPASHTSYTVSGASNDINRVLLVGTTADGKKNVSWTKLSYRQGAKWSYVESNADKYLLPLYGNLTVVGYDDAALALGTKAGGSFGPMLLSRDGGITWKSDESFSYPKEAQPAATFTAAADNDGYIWIVSSTKVWRGRLNRVGWKLNLDRMTE